MNCEYIFIVICLVKSVLTTDLSWKFKRSMLKEIMKYHEHYHDFNVLDYISYFGYPSEEHYLTTEDGFKLALYRIPFGLNSPLRPTLKKPVVLLQPGMLMSCGIFLDYDPTSALAFLLAERGYDVWLGNYRGTTLSRNHVQLDPSTEEFWDFSWHEMGVYDNPAMIDYVLNVTKKQTLNYVGFSQGSTTFFVTTSELPEYNSKINLMVALAPVVFLGNLNDSAACMWLENFEVLKKTMFEDLNIIEIMPRSLFTEMVQQDCDFDDDNSYCMLFLRMINGANLDVLNLRLQIFSHLPAGASIGQIEHFAQLYKNKDKFSKFDYGDTENLRLYHSAKPPEYNLTNVIAPVFIAYTSMDPYIQQPDLQLLVDHLPNVIDIYQAKDAWYSHLSFLYSANVKESLHEKLFDILDEHNSKPDFQYPKEDDDGFIWSLISTLSNWIGF